MFHGVSVGTEEIRSIPGNQTTLDLRDLVVGVSYGVSVTALVGENEGDPVTVYIKPGELGRDFVSFSFVPPGWSGGPPLKVYPHEAASPIGARVT